MAKIVSNEAKFALDKIFYRLSIGEKGLRTCIKNVQIEEGKVLEICYTENKVTQNILEYGYCYMKILLTAINAKYIHSNPAVYSLRAYAGEKLAPYLEVAEYTINHNMEDILADLYRKRPDVIAFSCYIWNWNMVSVLVCELPKILENVPIWLGGPEVSYDPEELMKKYPTVTGIMVGEGEETFRELAKYYCEDIDTAGRKKTLNDIHGIVFRTQEPSSAGAEICRTPPRELTDISKLPFLYQDLDTFANRIVYYESSRGCPFRCSYCLSSIDKKVRLRNLEIVKKELRFFLENNVKQIKFVDRTFNCNHEHATGIWEFLSKNDNGVTNFHFEISADLLTEEELELLAKVRPGLMQMEIGVQTLNFETLREIRRTADIPKLKEAVKRIKSSRNIHVHLDLIAGLPFEDYESFKESFNGVYAMQPDQLQLGFLKVLKGSYMYEKAAEYEICYTDLPPYEVLSTKWLPYEKLLLLKQVEEMVEIYYNSNQFTYTLPVLQTAFPDAFTMYLDLADFYCKQGYSLVTPSRSYRYQALLHFAMSTDLAKQDELLRQSLTFDLYLRENLKNRPAFAKDLTTYKEPIRDFYKKEETDRHCLPAYADYDSKQLARMTHIEVFNYPVWEADITKRMQRLDIPRMVLFDYRTRDALTYEARYIVMR